MTWDFRKYDYEICRDMDRFEESSPQSSASASLTPITQKLEGFKFLLGLTEIVGIFLVILMIIWVTNFRGGFSWSDPNYVFNWHPVLMTIGLVFLYANGMLIYRCKRTIRKQRLKLIHSGILIFSLMLTIIGLVSVFNSHNFQTPPIPNMYSLHSWIGLTSVILFACQWLAGFVSFLYPGVAAPLRSSYSPIHIYFGTAAFIGVITSCLLGLNEKAIFTLKGKYSEFVEEGVFINIIGLVLLIFGGLTVYLVSQERYKREPRDEDNLLLSG
ncbi:hypothetical protein PV327_009500 [Microctonus hyperodae]|uniref:Cytochrome b561 domain-containing protein n=2 Tax=Microctonus hyperodae TaxID=165561 RepID=A0AA39FTX5_MICHY|nr:hypothetical protein PV327_009500 [Microctonus hyperodae]